ncbi:MAG: UDP-N-acetylglucosamine 1-carboxyvinyltransferase [Campylobacterales bacterium]|nr:UDP-N-acetylglucosamine 1-carboxyvinyltransferase [Campylobacterales bacterium]
MDFLKVHGDRKLNGDISISGAKNSALPLISSTILAKNSVEISNVPNVVDIKTFLKLIKMLNGSYEFENNRAIINTSTINNTVANYDIVKTMRASILVLGPLLSRFGQCEVSLPGGCAIGQRPVDLHIKALLQMGAEIDIKGGYIKAIAPNGLTGTTIMFDKITVTGTENIITAATLAKGKTKIINAAKEPEVVQLCLELKNSGVEIEGIGTDELTIIGRDRELIEYKPIKVIPDRIEAGTYLCAGAITNSKITLKNVNSEHISSIISKLSQMNFKLDVLENEVTINPTNKILPTEIVTTEYPGFPTDMQAQFMALATQAEGTSIIEERLFENRFMHSSELNRLGADIHLKGNIATIYGKTELYGADVMATDLRASSALVLAGLIAKGKTNIHRIYHLDRGYENIEKKLNNIGAKIDRLRE